MKINYTSRLEFDKGDQVVLRTGKKALTPEQRETLKKYNIDEAYRRHLNTPGYTFTVVDTDSIYQPTMSVDLPGVKVYNQKAKYWVLPRWALMKTK